MASQGAEQDQTDRDHFTNSATLDLFPIGDPATSRAIAQYRETSDDLAAIKMISEVDAHSYRWMAKFFKPLIRR